MITQYCSEYDRATSRPRRQRRSGMILVFLIVALPAILAMVALVYDGGLLVSDSRTLHHAVDAGATASAMDLLLGKDDMAAANTADEYVRQLNNAADAAVNSHIPPISGPYTGEPGYVEVVASRPYKTRLMHIVGASGVQTITARAVAGVQDSTVGAAVVVLDPSPAPFAVSGVPLTLTLPSLPALLGGLEVLGLGTVRVDGAVLVNTTWGGVDENGDPAGEAAGPPYGVSCTPLIGLTRLQARDIRVAGGVDNPNYYADFVSGEPSPLRANRLPVPDPFASLPVPTTSVDVANVSGVARGSVSVVAIPLVTAPVVLQPGVYDWIEVLSGSAVFEPGVYIIRGVNPVTNIGLNLVGGNVVANGVMFYLTNSSDFSAATGTPDASDGETAPPATSPANQAPSAVINAALMGSISPLSDPQSPFDGLLVYQRRHDYRPIVIAHQSLLLGGSVAGTVYAKWGHVLFVGSQTTYDLRIVAGTVRLLTVGGMTIAPSQLLPPARDVYLVE